MANNGNEIYVDNTSGVRITQDVSPVIGVASNNLGFLIAKARVGGANGYAYKITESGGTDGTLIDGAAPHHNLFSNVSPGQWTIFPDNTIRHKLKKTIGEYNFLLKGGFNGYRHNTVKPSLETICINTAISDNQAISQLTGGVIMGEYKWRQMLTNHGFGNQYRFKVGVRLSISNTVIEFISGDYLNDNQQIYYFGGDLTNPTLGSGGTAELIFRRLHADSETDGVDYKIQDTGQFKTLISVPNNIRDIRNFETFEWYGYSKLSLASAYQEAVDYAWVSQGQIFKKISDGKFYNGKHAGVGHPSSGFYAVAEGPIIEQCGWVRLNSSGDVIDSSGAGV